MKQQHYLIKGTFFLTLTGFVTRFAGFFYKIFLSRKFGAEEIGIFQLTMPVYMFALALSSGGIQTAISRFTAEYYAKKDKKAALRTLLAGLILSVGMSLACTVTLFLCSDWIASRFLLEPGCAPLLRIISISLPFSVIHGCIGGFFTGQKNVRVSAFAQLTEQMVRIATVLLVFAAFQKAGRPVSAVVMALGQVAGESVSALFCVCCLWLKGKQDSAAHSEPQLGKAKAIFNSIRDSSLSNALSRTLSVSAPLGLNHMLICVLQGIEAAMLPQQLQRFGLSTGDALSSYGTLTGMALPLIMFPTAVTGALGMLLLPTVSEARALHHDRQISVTVNATFQGGMLLGCFCLTAFLLFGGEAGTLIFHNALAGAYIRRLAFLCPFLYINTTMASILHALGKTGTIFVWNLCSFLLRLCFIVLLIPKIGIDGFLAGLVLAQFFITVCTLTVLHRETALTVSISDTVLKYGGLSILCGAAVYLLRQTFSLFSKNTLPGIILAAAVYCILFALPVMYSLRKKTLRIKGVKMT